MKLFCGVAIAIWIGSAPLAWAASSLPDMGAHVTVMESAIACRERSDVEAVFKLLQEGDGEAAMALIKEKRDTCEVFGGDMIATVEDLSTLHNMACLRAKGRPHCFWSFPSSIAGN